MSALGSAPVPMPRPVVPVPRPVRVLTGAACAGAVLFLVSTLLPELLRDGGAARSAWWDSGVYLAVSVLAAAGCTARAALVGVERVAWTVFAAALWCNALGDALWLRDADSTAASIAYLGFSPLVCAGIVLLARRRVPRSSLGTWLDGVVAGLAAGAVVAALGLGAVADGGGALALPVVGALCNVVVACVVAGVVAMTGGRPGHTWLLLGTGLALIGTSDLVYAGRDAAGTYAEGGLLDAGWLAGSALLSAAAASRRVRLPVRVPDWASVVIPAGATVAASTVLVVATHAVATALAAVAVLVAVARIVRSFADLLRPGAVAAAGGVDPLTGLATRGTLTARLDAIVARDEPAALLVVDLDRFRALNETLGHEAGDRVLADVAQRLRDAVRPGDLLARLGGDEFAVLLTGEHDAAGARALAQRLRLQFDLAFAVDGITVQLDASIGMALRPLHARSASDLLRTADLAMEEAKAERTGVVTYRPRAVGDARDRLALIGQLRAALDRGELVIHLQPLVDAETERLVSVEALVRWQHPERGLLGPGEFLPGVEQANLMRPLTEYVVREALLLSKQWRDAGRPTPIAVNVAGPNLLDLAFAETLERMLAETGAVAADLRLEITEDGVMLDEGRVLAGMAALRRLGVTVALDDFGTGQSSLSRLRRLPVDVLKIDRSFVMGMEAGGPDGAIVRAAASLGRELGLTVVAEGVETRGAWHAVREAGCHLVQGYLVSRPLDVAAFELWRAAWVPGAAARV